MITSSNKKSEATMEDVIALISDFKAGNFSKQLNKTSDPKLKDLVDSLNDVSKILATQATQATQAEIEQSFNSSPIGLFYFDREYRFLRINERMAEINGFSVAHHIGKTLDEIAPDLAGFLKELYRPIFERGEPVLNVEIHGKTPKDPDHERDWIGNYFPLKSETGEVTGLIGAVLEITELKIVEREKEAILKRLNYALDASGDGIWDWTPADGKRVFSKAWIEMLGYEVGELASLASEWSDRLHPDDVEWVFAAINKVTQTPENGDTWIHEYRFRNKAGDYLWILNKAKVVERNEKGEASRVVGTHTNITERKRSEQLMQEAKITAENATIIKSRFLDIAAHELRTPVTAFSLLLQLTQTQLEKGFPFEASVLTRLRVMADKISRLVVDLLDVSRLERGAVTLNLERIDLNSVITECVDDLKLREPDRMIKIIKPETPVELNCDSLRINQVISNVLENARKYTPKQSPFEITVETKPGQVRISITDHGPGISDEQKTNLFNAFSRGEEELTSRSGGLGLGLYICSQIIKLHGGTIGVISKVGEGSTFYFELPTGEVK